jgi:2-octaprenyl-6-methoxyphenol hydroxylase
MISMHNEYDIIIVGGGLVGAALACALDGLPFKVALVEARPLATDAPGDGRHIALAYGTRCIFDTLGVWDELAPHAAPIHRIHISERGRFGATRLDRDDNGVPALGYVAGANAIGRVLQGRLGGLSNVTLYCPAQVDGVAIGADHAAVTLADAAVLTARVLIAADGAHSSVRERLGIATRRRTYGQTAVVATVRPAHPHRNQAYERFTDSGPLALLPLADGRFGVVFTLRDEQVEAVMALDDVGFLARLQARFGHRLGDFVEASSRHAFPLELVRAEQSVRERLALIGNAALHPVAGQGFNLGMRDVAALAEVLADAAAQDEDIGALHVLERYAAWRDRDQRGVIAFTDGIARLFTNPLVPVAAARGLGLLAIDLFPPLQRALCRRTMGLAGRLPRLARGLRIGGGQT